MVEDSQTTMKGLVGLGAQPSVSMLFCRNAIMMTLSGADFKFFFYYVNGAIMKSTSEPDGADTCKEHEGRSRIWCWRKQDCLILSFPYTLYIGAA